MGFFIPGKRVVLGVSGGIAAYKAAELVRLLIKDEALVRVLMTENACRFVGPITFEALSQQRVCSTLFEISDEAAVQHIHWAKEADAVVSRPGDGQHHRKAGGRHRRRRAEYLHVGRYLPGSDLPGNEH